MDLTSGKEAIGRSSANTISSLDSRLERLTMAMEQMAKDHKDVARSNRKLASVFTEFLDEWAYFRPCEDSEGSSAEISDAVCQLWFMSRHRRPVAAHVACLLERACHLEKPPVVPVPCHDLHSHW